MAVEASLVVDVEMSVDDAVKASERYEISIKKIKKETDKTAAALKKTQRAFQSMATQATITGAAIVSGFAGATKVFSDFDKSATNVQNIIDGTADEIDQLKSAVMGLPPELGDATELMDALYQTLSSGVPQGNAIDFLEMHAKAAKGNVADLTQTVDAGSSIMNAYSLTIGDMTGVLDAMTKTVDLGKLTFSDLSDNIGKGISIAASAGVTYQELLSTLASLTLNGLSVEEAMTAVRNILLVSLKPTSDTAKAAAQLGIDMSSASLQAKGFAQWMGDVATATEGNAEMVAKLFPNIRALNGAMKLASEEGGAKYVEILGKIENSSGKVEENFARMSQSFGEQVNAMTNELKKLGIEFGALASESILPMIKGARGIISAFRDLSPAAKQNIIDIGKFTLAVSGFVIVAPKMIGALLAIKKGIGAIAASNVAAKLGMSTMALGAWAGAAGAAIIAAQALAMWFDTLNQLTPEFKQELEAAANAEIQFAEAAKELGVSAADLIREHGSLEEALKKLRGESDATAESLEQLDEIYNNMVASQQQATDEIGRFREELAERGILAEVEREYNGLAGAYEAAQNKASLLGIALEKVRADMRAEAEAAKEAAEAEKKAAAAHAANKKAIMEKANAYIKEAEAVGTSLDQTEKKLAAITKEIDETEEYNRKHQEFLEESEKTNESFFDSVKDNIVGAFESLPAPIKAAIDEMKAFATQSQEVAQTKIELQVEMPRIAQVMGELSGLTSAFSRTMGDALYDGIQGNLPSIHELFRGFSQDIGNTLFEELNTAINDAFGAAAEAMEGGGEGGEGGIGAGIEAFFGKLDKDFWLNAGAAVATAFSGRAQQDADKTGAAIGGAVSGAIQGAKFGVVGAVVGAVIGGIIGYLGASAADTPRARANLGYTAQGWFGDLETRKAQLFTEEMERTWVQQQAAIFDAFKSGYLSIIEMFGDPSLLEDLTLANLPSFQMPTGEWMEASASDLATYLKETYWPQAFRDYFSAALEAGLGAYGVTDASVAALMGELERLPGAQTMQALADFVQAVVGSAQLLEGMDFESIWEEVIQSPRAAMASMGEEITAQLEIWSTGWEGLTGIEQARKLIKITELVSQARESEIQYLRQIHQIQQQINRAIFDQIEQLRLSGMTEPQQVDYAWQRLQEIFSQLADPDIDAGTVANLTADAQNYIRLLTDLLGEDLTAIIGPSLPRGSFFDSILAQLPQEMVEMLRGMTVQEGLIALLEHLGGLAGDAIEGEITDSETRLAEYNRILGETNALLLTFGELLDQINGNLSDLGVTPQDPEPPAQDDPEQENDNPIIEDEPRVPRTTRESGAYAGMTTMSTEVNDPIMTAIDLMSEAIDSLPNMVAAAVSKVQLPAPKMTMVANISGSIDPLISIIDARILEWLSGTPARGME